MLQQCNMVMTNLDKVSCYLMKLMGTCTPLMAALRKTDTIISSYFIKVRLFSLPCLLYWEATKGCAKDLVVSFSLAPYSNSNDFCASSLLKNGIVITSSTNIWSYIAKPVGGTKCCEEALLFQILILHFYCTFIGGMHFMVSGR